MKRRLYMALTLLVSLLFVAEVYGQKEKQPADKFTLLTMPYNKRPLTLYKGQFQSNIAYRLGVRTKSYDADGDKISLKKDGSASIVHTYLIELKYGITDFIEISADSYFLKNGIRSPSWYFLSGSDVISVNTLNDYKGFGDITLAIAVRAPIDYKLFDISFRGGLTLPVAPYKPSEPTHTITDYKTPNNFSVNYHFNNNNGYGVPLYFLSAAVKGTLSKLSLEARGLYKFPAKKGESLRWEWTLYGSTFTYFSKAYSYLPDRSLIISGSAHYQAAGWFDLFLGGYYSGTSSGWTEYYDLKYANPESSLVTLEPGFELQISPSLTIYQYTGVNVSGKSINAPFYLLTTISFNAFPFLK